jgi:hypothetical protein
VKKRDFVLLIVYSFLMVIVANGASFLVGTWTDNEGAMFITMGVVTVVGGYFLLRWWLRKARAAGIVKAKWTPSRVTFAMAYMSAILLAVAVNDANYAFTRSRISEFAVSAVALLPILAFLAWKGSRLANPPKPQEASMLRFSFYMQWALTIIFSLSLAIQMHPEHHDYGLATLHNLNIAAFIVLIPLFPINAYYLRKRYLQARDFTTPSYRL